MLRVNENLLLKQSTLGQHKESVANTNISKSPKMQENAIFFQEINNFSKIIRENIFLKLESVGQNYFSGLHAKKSGVIFFQPKLLTPKHSARVPNCCVHTPILSGTIFPTTRSFLGTTCLLIFKFKH